MKHLLFISVTLLLSACGAADRGYVVNKVESNGTVGKITHVTLPSDATEIKFNTCYPLNRIFLNQEVGVAALFEGMSACPSTTNADIIKIKAGSALPDAQRVCVIPATATLGKEVCLTITDEENIKVAISNATSVYVVRESDLAAFKIYASNLSGYFPAYASRAFAFVSSAK